MSITKKILYSTLILTIIPLLIMPIIGYLYIRNIIKEQMTVLSDQNLHSISSSIDSVIDDIISASNAVVLDTEVLEALQNKGKHSSYENKKWMEAKLGAIETGTLYPYNTSTMVIDFDGNIYTTGIFTPNNLSLDYEEITSQWWFKQAIQNKGYFLWIAPSNKYFLNNKIDDHGSGIVMVRLIKDHFTVPRGVLAIHVSTERKIKDLLTLENKFEGMELYLINENGDFILGDDIQKPFQPMMSKEFIDNMNINTGSFTTEMNRIKVIVSTRKIEKTGWRIIQLVPYDSIMRQAKNYRSFTILLNFIFMNILIISAFFMSKYITKSIRNLTETVKEVGEGNFQIRSTISGSYEINILSKSFNIMLDKIQQLIEEVKYETEQRQRAKLEALQAQINPHFLFNTLNGIKWLCIIEGAKNAEKMLLSLGYLLENTMGKHEEIITLEEEIICLEHYVTLQTMRYGKKFAVSYEVPEKLKNIKIPVLLLQPIVENAILHAFEDKEEMGTIQISGVEEEEYVYLFVEDDGVGMTSKEIENIFDRQINKKKYNSIGIKNVKERIKLNYGEDCDLIIHSTYNKGTKVTLKIKRMLEL